MAQTYPSRPITMIVSAAAGSTSPAPPVAKPSEFARIMIEALQAQHKATGEGPVPVDVSAGERAADAVLKLIGRR